MISNTIKYGIRNAPPPFASAVKGNLQTFPKPTDIAMHDIKNSTSLPQLPRSATGFDDADVAVVWLPSDTPFFNVPWTQFRILNEQTENTE